MKSGSRQFRRRVSAADDEEDEGPDNGSVPPVLAPAALRAAAAKAKQQRQQQQQKQRPALSFGNVNDEGDGSDESDDDDDEDAGALLAAPSLSRKSKGMRASGVKLSSLVAKDEAELPRATTLRAAAGARFQCL